MAIDQRKLDQEFVFSGKGTFLELSADLDRIAVLEEQEKGRVALSRWSALAAFVVLVIPAVLGVAGGTIFAVPAVLVPVGILIYSAIAGRNRILPDRVAVLRLILTMLNRDCGRKGRFQVLLRLRSSREKIQESSNPHRPGQQQKLFRDSWLALNGSLSDGTSIHESCVDLIRQRTKKNARGKVKTKERRVCLLRVQLDYNAGTYGNATAPAAKLRNPFRLPVGAKMKAFRVTEKAFDMKTVVKDDVSPANLGTSTEAMLLGAYRILNLARRSAPAIGGPK